jgi:hypothetical protein
MKKRFKRALSFFVVIEDYEADLEDEDYPKARNRYPRRPLII